MLASGSLRRLLGVAGILASSASMATTYGLSARNEPRVFSDALGRCYARSVPFRGRGSTGKTSIFRVSKGGDVLVHAFPWYSDNLAIKCSNLGSRSGFSVSVVRLEPPMRSESGEVSGTVTLAIYLDGKLLAEYTASDLGVIPGDRSSTSERLPRGYRQALGYRQEGRRQVFRVCATRNRILTFDILNGDLIGEFTDHWKRCE